jgi:hypothetical protein
MKARVFFSCDDVASWWYIFFHGDDDDGSILLSVDFLFSIFNMEFGLTLINGALKVFYIMFGTLCVCIWDVRVLLEMIILA